MKLSEIKGEQALEVIAEIIDPLTMILADEEVKEAAGKAKIDAIKIVLKKYPKQIIYILALLNGENPETYEPSLLVLPKMLIEITEDEEFKQVFSSAAVTAGFDVSGSVQEITKDKK